MLVGIFAYVMLPNSIATAPFLSEKERVFAVTRLHLDTPSRLALDGRWVILTNQYSVRKTDDDSEHHHEVFRWSEVMRGILSPSTWLSACAYFGILAGLYSFGLFVSSPPLLRSLI